MNKRIYKTLAFCLILSFNVSLVACSRATDVPTEVSAPSSTVAPTATTTPSPEPTPTDTPTPTPTPDLRIAVNRKNFPDSAFRNYILDHFDTDYDDMVSPNDLGVVMTLDLTDRGIEDLTGIEYFPYLHNLNCSKNRLQKLDLSSIKRLDILNCSDNPDLTSVTLGDNVQKLERLNCNNTNFTLDIFQCKKLIELHSRQSGLKQLEFREDSPLEILDCTNALLSISGCKQLRTINCENCNLRKSTSFDFGFPELTELIISGTNIVDFDLSGCAKLKTLRITSSKLGTFRAKNLEQLWMAEVAADVPYGDPWKATADFSNCKKLIWLGVYGVKSVNVSGCKSLSENSLSYDWEHTKVTGLTTH